jgi:N-formylglutamate deformylase
VTGLCPVDLFDDQPLYRDPQDLPTEAEIAARREAIWRPYHAQLASELARLKAQHGVAALWDAHSIRSVVPRFFEGKLADLNLGTADGASCDAGLAARLLTLGQQAPGYTAVLNGRFKGGHITRFYGQPAQGIHAIQMEMTQCCYMQETWPFDYLPQVAKGVQPIVRRMLQEVLTFVEGEGQARA